MSEKAKRQKDKYTEEELIDLFQSGEIGSLEFITWRGGDVEVAFNVFCKEHKLNVEEEASAEIFIRERQDWLEKGIDGEMV